MLTGCLAEQEQVPHPPLSSLLRKKWQKLTISWGLAHTLNNVVKYFYGATSTTFKDCYSGHLKLSVKDICALFFLWNGSVTFKRYRLQLIEKGKASTFTVKFSSLLNTKFHKYNHLIIIT